MITHAPLTRARNVIFVFSWVAMINHMRKMSLPVENSGAMFLSFLEFTQLVAVHLAGANGRV